MVGTTCAFILLFDAKQNEPDNNNFSIISFRDMTLAFKLRIVIKIRFIYRIYL